MLLFSLHFIPVQSQVFFTESFNRGIPASWTPITLEGNGSWAYTNEAPQEGKFPKLQSPSSGNGWAIFDSDLNCDYISQDAWLVSPPISAADRERVFLVFETLYRKFDDKIFIRIGNNVADLDSWASVELFSDVGNNEYSHRNSFADELHNPQNTVVDLTPYAAGQSSFRFAFQFLSDETTEKFGASGCAYFWQIDDIRLTELGNELVVDTVRVAPNYATPISQVSEINFAGKVTNTGLNDQNDVRLNVKISDKMGLINEFTSSPVEGVNTGSSELLTLNNGFLPRAIDTFYMDYEVTQSESDDNPSSSIYKTKFQITQNVFAKDNGLVKSLTAPGAVNEGIWEVGHYFFIPNPGDRATHIAFAAGSAPGADGSYPHFGQTVNAFLYRIEEDDNPDFFNDNEAKIVGFGSFTYEEEPFNQLVSVELSNLENTDPGVELVAGEQYLAVIELPDYMGITYTELPYFYDPATVVNNGRWFLGGFGPHITPIVRLIIQGGPNSNKSEIADHQLSLYPNPVVNTVSLDYEFDSQVEELSINMTDLMGSVLDTKFLNNTRTGQVNWAVSHLPTGSYFINIVSSTGVKSLPFTIQR